MLTTEALAGAPWLTLVELRISRQMAASVFALSAHTPCDGEFRLRYAPLSPRIRDQKNKYRFLF